MSPNLVEANASTAAADNHRGAANRPERRRRPRTPVRWPVTVFRPNYPDSVDSITLNLSSDGFYCLIDAPCAIGESLLVLLRAPSHHPADGNSTCTLRCQARVLRVEPADGRYGIACRIEDYSLDPR